MHPDSYLFQSYLSLENKIKVVEIALQSAERELERLYEEIGIKDYQAIDYSKERVQGGFKKKDDLEVIACHVELRSNIVSNNLLLDQYKKELKVLETCFKNLRKEDLRFEVFYHVYVKGEKNLRIVSDKINVSYQHVRRIHAALKKELQDIYNKLSVKYNKNSSWYNDATISMVKW